MMSCKIIISQCYANPIRHRLYVDTIIGLVPVGHRMFSQSLPIDQQFVFDTASEAAKERMKLDKLLAESTTTETRKKKSKNNGTPHE